MAVFSHIDFYSRFTELLCTCTHVGDSDTSVMPESTVDGSETSKKSKTETRKGDPYSTHMTGQHVKS